ncbi:MAG: DNA-binding response regulator [Pedobacter sp.]|jgi:DNA-binding NarL/FixJ family response regulator|nr:DNA-binding response regulator [Pedobacter sp.]
MIRAAIVEDNNRYRNLLRKTLNSSDAIKLVFERKHCLNILADVVRYDPDVLVIGINLSGKDGINGLIKLKAACPEVKILMLTVFEDEENIFEAIKAGANGYLLKKDSPQKILDAIFELNDGKASINGLVAKKLIDYFFTTTASAEAEDFHLTQREDEILKLLIEGLSYKNIAAKCFISRETINSHVKHIYHKLNMHSRAEISARFREK